MKHTYSFKDGIVLSYILPWYNARSTHQSASNVTDDVTIEIRHHHHIKLLGFGYQLHIVKTKENKLSMSVLC